MTTGRVVLFSVAKKCLRHILEFNQHLYVCIQCLSWVHVLNNFEMKKWVTHFKVFFLELFQTVTSDFTIKFEGISSDHWNCEN